MKNKTIIFVIIAIALLVGLIAFLTLNNTNKNNNPQNASSNTVNIQNFAFDPTSITLKKGETVIWDNNDAATHHIAADDGSFDLGDQEGGSTVQHTFNATGTYNYHCSIHTSMKGVVVVK